MAAVVRKSTRDRNTTASELAVGDFVLFDAHDDEDEPIWLGRVMSNPEWNGQGVYKNKEGKNVKFNDVSIGRGKVAIYVMLHEKINVMSEKLESWMSQSEQGPLVQNNRYLIPVDVNLHQMAGQKNQVPKLRISKREERWINQQKTHKKESETSTTRS